MTQGISKREEIIQELRKSLSKTGVNVRYSSPKIKYFYLSKMQVPADVPEEKPASLEEPNWPSLQDDFPGLDLEIHTLESIRQQEQEEEEIDYSKLTPKEFKKLQKEKEKEEKRFIQIRKDAHKRGYDTSVLRQFEDPEELYSMSDKEIDQMQAVGYINEDGFYDFVYPPDAESLKKEGLSKKRVMLILLLIAAGGGMLAWLFMSIFHVF